MYTDRISVRTLFDDFKLGALQSAAPCNVAGWIRTSRSSKSVGFLEINDGSCFKNVQIVYDSDNIANYDEITALNVGASVLVAGHCVLTPQARQPFEIHAHSITVEGASRPEYPLQKKKHSLEFLRGIAHLRPRTNTFSAVFRVRSQAALAIHRFFGERGFTYVHTPIISCSDCEGAGEMFRVTTDSDEEFFGKNAYLTVSGQLQGEAMATALGNIYTFGPTFRAECSHTPRHAAEFWMIEPEIAFADLNDDMQLAEDMMKYVTAQILELCSDELDFLEAMYSPELKARLRQTLNVEHFTHMTYTDAITALQKAPVSFEYKPEWGCDLQTEHERYLTEVLCNGAVFVTDYPKEIKAFYMRLNEDGRTVAAMDLLMPSIGEIIGGSQREEREAVLLERIEECGLERDSYDWYLDLRRYGSVHHAGFGLGFERLVLYLTGMANIRDVLPFPRTAGSALF